MEELEGILNDDRYQALDVKGQSDIRNSYFDEEVEAGRMDELDRFAANGLLDSSSSYHKEGGPQKEHIKNQFNLFRDLQETIEGGDKATRSIAAQRFINQHASLERAEQNAYKNSSENQRLAAVIQLGDAKEIELQRDKKGIFKGSIMEYLFEGVEGLLDTAGKAISTSAGATTFNFIGNTEAFADTSPREQRELDAAAAKETLRAKGFDDDGIEKLLRDFDHDTMDFNEDFKLEPFRRAKSGEVIFNNEALLRMSSEELSIRLDKAGFSEAAKERGLDRLHMEKNDAISNFSSRTVDPYFIDGINEREGTWEERIDSYLTDVEDGNSFKKFYTASVNNINSSLTSMVGGTVGLVAGHTEAGRKFSEFTEDLSGQMWEGNQRLKQGWIGELSAELVGLAPDLFIAKGAGTIAKSFVKLRKLKGISKARSAGARGKMGEAEAAKWIKFEEQVVKGGVSLGSGYSAGSRVVNQALAQVDENGEPSFEYSDAIMFGFKQVLITGLVTRVGSGSGTERFATGAAFKGEARKFWKDYVVKDMLGEGVEESIDELVSGMLVSRKMNPDMTTGEIVDQALHAFILGGIMGGGTNIKTPWDVGKKQLKKASSLINPAPTLSTSRIGLGSTPEGTTLTPETNAALGESPLGNATTEGLPAPAVEPVEGAAPLGQEAPATDMPDLASLAKEVQYKLVNKEPITKEDRKHWIEAGKAESDLPHPDLDTETDFSERGGGPDESAGLRKPAAAQAPPTPQAGPTPTPKTQPASTKPPVKREVDPDTGEVDIGEGVKIKAGPNAPSIAQQIFGDPTSPKETVTGSVDIDRVSVKKGKDGKKRVYIDEQVTDQIVRNDGTFKTDRKSKSTLTAESFHSGKRAATKKTTTPQVESTQEAGESLAKTEGTLKSPSRQFIEDGKGVQKETRAALVSKGGSKDLDILAKDSPVEAVEGASRGGQYNPETGKVEIDPNETSGALFRQSTLPRISAEKAALTGEGKVEETTKALNQEVVSKVLGHRLSGLSPEQRTRLFIVEALMGNKEAQAELLRVAGAEGGGVTAGEIRGVVQGVMAAKKGESSQGVLDRKHGEMAKAFEKETISLGAPATKGDAPSKRRLGDVKVSPVIFKALQVKRKEERSNRVAIDSGIESDENRITEVLEVGSIISVTTGEANARPEQWKVVGHHTNPDGSTRMELQKIQLTKAGIEAELAEYHKAPETREAIMSAMEEFRKLDPKENQKESRALLRKLITDALSRMTSGEYANSKLEFQAADKIANGPLAGRLMAVSGEFKNGKYVNTKILINEDLWWNKLYEWAGKTDGSNTVASSTAASDFAEGLNLVLFEEVAHDHALQELDRGEVAAMTRDWIEQARVDNGAKSELLKWRAYQLGNPSATTEELDAMWAELEELADKAATDPAASGELKGDELKAALKEQAEASEKLSEEALMIGHEALAGFVQLIKTGATTNSMEVLHDRWLHGWLSHETASVKATMGESSLFRSRKADKDRLSKAVKVAEAQTVIGRLLEMASRAFEAVQNYMKVHQTINDLPESVSAQVNKLLETLEYSKHLGVNPSSIKPPDPFNIHHRAMMHGKNDIDQNKALIESDDSDLFDAQQELRDVLSEIGSLGGVETGDIIRLEWVSSSLLGPRGHKANLVVRPEAEGVIPEDLLAELHEKLKPINESGRPTAIAKNAGSIHGIQLVMRRLGITQGELVDQDAESMRDAKVAALADAQRRVADSLGLDIDELVEALSEAHERAIAGNLEKAIASIPGELTSLDVSGDGYGEAGKKMTAARGEVARLTETIKSLDSKDTLSDSEKEALDVARAEFDEARWNLFVMEQDARGFRPRADTEFLPSPKVNHSGGGMSRPGDFVPSTSGPMYKEESVRNAIKENDAALKAHLMAIDRLREESPIGGFRTFGGMLRTFERDNERAKNSRTKFNPFRDALRSELRVTRPSDEGRVLPEPRTDHQPGEPASDDKPVTRSRIMPNLEVDGSRTITALEEAVLMRDTIDGLMNVEAEMQFALLGGPKPRRLRQRKGSDQDNQPININLTSETAKDVRVPIGIAHVVRGYFSDRLESLESGEEGHAGKELVERVELKRDERAAERIARVVELSEILNKLNHGTEEYLAARSELFGLRKDLKSIGLKTQFEDGAGKVLSVTFESSLPDDVFEHTTKSGLSLGKLVNKLGESLLAGERASFGVLGLDVDLLESDRSARDVAEWKASLRYNARVLAERLSRQWVARHAQGDSKVDNAITGGFPFEVEETKVTDQDGYETGDVIRRFYPRAKWFDVRRPDPIDPNAKYDGNRELLDLVAKGEVGDVILEVASRLDAMESPSTVSDQAVLSHEYGLTPAGLVHQIVANPFTALLVRLKGTTLSKRGELGKMEHIPVVDLLVEAALAEGGAAGKVKAERIKAIFNGLARGIEFDKSSWGDNTKPEAKAGKSHRGFTDFRGVLDAANEAYVQTMKSLISGRSGRDVIRAAKTSNDILVQPREHIIQSNSLTLGIDYDLLVKMDRDYRVATAERRRHENDRDSTVLSLIVPDRAREMLDYFDRYQARSRELRIVHTSDGPKVMPETDDIRESAGASSINDMGQERASVDAELQKAQDHLNLMAKLRSAVLMELNGGSMERVLRLLDSGGNRSIVVLPNGDTKNEYHWDKIDSDIMDQLAHFAEKEAELGVVRFSEARVVGRGGGQEGIIDARLKEMVKEEGAMDYGEESRPDFEGMPIHQIALSGPRPESALSRHVSHFNPEWGEKPADLAGFDQDNLDSWARFLGVKANLGLNPDAPESAKDFVEPPLSDTETLAYRRYPAGENLRERVSEAYDAHIAGRPMLNNEGKALTAALQSGGRASRWLRANETQIEAATDTETAHTATAWEIMQTIVSQIPEITLIKGEKIQGREDDAPSIAFIGTENDPVIVVPFRYWSNVKAEDIHRVTKEMMVYIAKRNGTDLVELATSLLQPLVDAHNDDASPRLNKHFIEQAEKATQAKLGRGLTPAERHMAGAQADAAWKTIKQMILLELGAMPEEGAHSARTWGDPARAEGAIADMSRSGKPDGEKSDAAIDRAADIVATFLTSEPLKRVLAMSSVGLVVPSYPNHPNQSRGKLVTADLMMRVEGRKLARFIVDQADDTDAVAVDHATAIEITEAMAANFGEGYFAGPGGSLVDSRTAETLQPSDDAGIPSNELHPQMMAGKLQSGSTGRKFKALAANEGLNNAVVWTVLADGADQANNLLVNTIVKLDEPFDEGRKPAGIKVDHRPDDGVGAQLTEYEALQLIKLFSESELADIGRKLEPPMTLGRIPDSFTVPELQKWNAKAAAILRKRFVAVASSHDEEYDVFARWGRFKGSSYITGGNSNDKKIETNHRNSGMYAGMAALGLDARTRLSGEESEDPGRKTLDVRGNNEATLRAKMKKANIPTTIRNPSAGEMTHLDKLRTKALGEDPSLAGDALYEAISILAHTGKRPPGSVDPGTLGNSPLAIKMLLRDFDALENVEEIDLVSRAARRMEAAKQTKKDHLEAFRELVLDNTNRSMRLDEALRQLKEVRQNELDAPTAEAFLRMVDEGEAWNALSSLPAARKVLEQVVDTFFGGPEELLKDLADHLIGLDESGSIGAREVKMGVARGEEQPGLPFDSAERLPLERGEDRATQTTVESLRGFTGTDGKLKEVGETHGHDPEAPASFPPSEDYKLPKPVRLPGGPEMLRMQATTLRGGASFRGTEEVVYLADLVSEQGSPHFREKQSRVLDQIDEFERTYEVTPQKAVGVLAELVKEHNRVRYGISGRKTNAVLLAKLEVKVIKIAKDLNEWVDETTRVADAEFGVGVLSRVTQLRRHNKISPLPVEIGLLIEQARDKTLLAKISQFHEDAKAVTDPKYLAKRLQDNQISQSLQAFIDSSEHGSIDPIHGDLAGSIGRDTPTNFLAKSAVGAGIALNRASLQSVLRDSRGRGHSNRREMIIASLRAQMSQDIGFLYRDISQGLHREVSKLKKEFIHGEGNVPDLLGKLNNASLLASGLTEAEVMDTQIRALEAAIALDRAVTDEELTSMIRAEQKNVERERHFQGRISTFRSGSHLEVSLEGSAEEAELTQRVLADVAKIHTDLYSENRKAGKMGKSYVESEGRLVSDEINLIEEATDLADEQLIMMEKFRVALGKEAGVEYSVVGDLLVPKNADDRIRKILEKEDGEKKKGWRPKVFTPEAIRFSKAKEQIELYASSGNISDYSDFSGGNNVIDNKSVSDKEHDAIHHNRAKNVVNNLVKVGAFVYGKMTKGQEEAGKNLKSDHMKNAKALPVEMLSYLGKMQEWARVAKDVAMGYDKGAIDAFVDYKERLEAFMEVIGANTQRDHNIALAKHKADPKNNPEPKPLTDQPVSAEDAGNLMSMYTESKALMMGRMHAKSLSAGYVSGKMLIDKSTETRVFASLMHTDSKIRKIFARTVDAQQAAQSVGGILEYGLAVKGGATGGREGHKGHVDDLETEMIRIAPKRRRVLGGAVEKGAGKDRHWSETVDYEMSSQGYVGEMIASMLSEGTNVPEQAQKILNIFEATDRAYANADNKPIAKHFGSNKKVLNNQDIYRQQRELFTGTLEEMAAGGGHQVPEDAKAAIRKLMDDEARVYGEKLSDLMGYMMVVYQAQSQLIPKSERAGVDQHSFADGNARLLPASATYMKDGEQKHGMKGGMPLRWQRIFVKEKGMERDNPELLHDTVSMRGATFMQKPESGIEESIEEGEDGEDGEDSKVARNVLDIDGMGAPMALMDDMAYRMHVSLAFALSQEFTGLSTDPSRASEVSTNAEHVGFFKKYYGEQGNAHHKKMREIGLSLSILAQNIIENDTQRLKPKTATQDFMDTSNLVGMASALISFRQLAFQTIPAIMGYATFRGGLSGNWGVIPMFYKQAMGTLEGALPFMGEDTKQAWFGSRRRSSDVGKFIEKHSRGLFLRTADGQVEAESHIHGANPRVRNRTSAFSREGKPLHGFNKNVLNYIFAMGKGVSDGTMGASKAMLRTTIAKAEEVAIRSIFMNEVVKGVQTRVDLLNEGHGYADVTIEGLLKGDYDSFLTPDVLEPARIVSIDILGQSDSARKGSAFQRQDTVTGELWRGSTITFANHLLSTAANSHAALAMMRHGKKEELTKVKRHKEGGTKGNISYKKGDIIYDSSGKPQTETVIQRRSAREGAALLSTNVGQNVAYRLMDMAFVSNVVTSAAALIGRGLFDWDEDEAEERKQKWQTSLYGLDDGPEGRYDSAAGWISRALMGSRRPWGYDYGEGKFSDEQRLRDRTNMGMNVASEVINQMPYVGLLTSTTLGGSLSREGIQGVTRDWLGLPVFGGNRAGLSLGEGKYSGQASEDAFDRAVYWTTYAMSKDLGSRNYFFMGLNHMAQPFYHMSNAQKETSIATKSSLLPAVAPFVPRDFRQDLYEGGVAGVGGFGNKADVKPWHSTYKKRKEKGSGGIRDVRKRKKGNKRRKAGEKRK